MSNSSPLIISVLLDPNPVVCGATFRVSVLVEEATHARLEAYTHEELSNYTHNNLAVDPLD